MRQELVIFSGLAASTANKTLVSKRINTKYRIKRMRVFFDNTADDTVKVYPFISKDPEAPTAAQPAGQNFLEEFSQNPFFTGDGRNIETVFDHSVDTKGTYLKVYIVNSAASTPHIMVNITIQIDH